MAGMKNGWGIAALVLLASVGRGAEYAGTRVPGSEAHPLFTIHRSLNANVLVYEACLTPEGDFCETPVTAHWVMRAKKGEREPLTWLEETSAYGVILGSVSVDSVTFRLKPLPRAVTARRMERGGAWSVAAFTEIAGKPSRLTEIFIHSTGKGLLTRVGYIELKGERPETGEAVSERIEPAS